MFRMLEFVTVRVQIHHMTMYLMLLDWHQQLG